MKPVSKDSELVSRAALRVADLLGMHEAERPVVYLRAPNELVIGKNHECSVIQLSKGQLGNLAVDAVKLLRDWRGE